MVRKTNPGTEVPATHKADVGVAVVEVLATTFCTSAVVLCAGITFSWLLLPIIQYRLTKNGIYCMKFTEIVLP